MANQNNLHKVNYKLSRMHNTMLNWILLIAHEVLSEMKEKTVEMKLLYQIV